MLKLWHKQTVARLFVKTVTHCMQALGRYHWADSYKEYAANHAYLECRPVLGSRKHPGSWSLRDAEQCLARQYSFLASSSGLLPGARVEHCALALLEFARPHP